MGTKEDAKKLLSSLSPAQISAIFTDELNAVQPAEDDLEQAEKN